MASKPTTGQETVACDAIKKRELYDDGNLAVHRRYLKRWIESRHVCNACVVTKLVSGVLRPQR